MKVGKRVKLITFNGQLYPTGEVEKKEDYWKLVGLTGLIQQDPNEKNIYASFSKNRRVLVKFDEDLKIHGLISHNNIKNALWILTTDLQVIK
jgi:hypothetical protein